MEHLTTLFTALLSMALTALPVMAVVLLVRQALGKAPKRYSYALWLVVAFRLICPVSIDTEFSIIPVEFTGGETVSEWADTYSGDTRTFFDNLPEYDAAVEQGRPPIPAGENIFYVVTASDGISPPPTVERTIFPALTVLWLAGIASGVVYITISVLRLKRQVKTAVRRERNVWECDGIPTPFVLGLLRVRIYIPYHLSDEERVYVLAHEQYHIRHLDPWVKALALGILVVYWWNPAVWLCWVLFCRDMEMRCDEAVLAKLGEDVKRGYSLSLVSFAVDRRFPMALAFGEHDAARRVKHVLAWKRAKPAILALGTVAVLIVAVVCGTNASTASKVVVDFEEDGSVRVTADLKDSVQSWAIYEDVYQDGRLIESGPRIMDGFAEDGTGVSSRGFQATLRAELTEIDGAPALACNVEARGTFEVHRFLPGLDYTGMSTTLSEGDLDPNWNCLKTSLETGEDVILYSVLLSTKPDGGITVYAQDQSLSKVNDVVVQYRLVTSHQGAEAFEAAPLDLAQTLYDLRVETLNSREDPGGLKAIRTLLDALGVGDQMEYELGLYDMETGYLSALVTDHFWTGGIYGGETGLVIRFLEPRDREMNTNWEAVQYLLRALAPALEEVQCSWPNSAGGGTQGTNLYREDDDWMAEFLGYETLEQMGQSAQGIRVLLTYFLEQENPMGELARELHSWGPNVLRERPNVEKLLAVMDTGPYGDFTVEWLDGETVQVNFSQRSVTVEELDRAMTARAAMVMAVGEQVQRVNWCLPAESNYTVYLDRSQPDTWAKQLGYEDLADLGRTYEGLEQMLNYLNFDVTVALLRQARVGSSWQMMELLLRADLWGSPVELPAQVQAVANFDVTVPFEKAPADPETLDVAMARRAMVVLKFFPERVNRVCWSYPGESGTEHRTLHINEAGAILALSSDSRITQPIETTEDLERFIRFLNLDEKLFLHYAQEGDSMALPEAAVIPPEGTTPFTNLMGYDGYIQTETDGAGWQQRTYYGISGTEVLPIAESFGYEPDRDYIVDLDGDGVTELVANVQYGADGHEDVYVFRLGGDGPLGIQLGFLDLSDLPNHNDWGVNSTRAFYDPETETFHVRYAQKDTEEYGEVESRGLGRVVFDTWR